MSTFWSLWIIVLFVATMIGVTWLLLANTKGTPEDKTGHVYDGIEEYDNPLPAWWLQLFVVTIIFTIGYVIAYPGFGSFPGLLNWTQEKQYREEVERAEQKYGAIYDKYAAMSIEEVATDDQAVKMGRRLFANNCAQCHGSDARGTTGYPNLADNAWLWGGSPEQIKTSIVEGRVGAMPAWASALQDEGVEQVTAYVKSLSGMEHDGAAAEQGAQKYSMYCQSCHGPEGKGNIAFGAPDLTDDVWLYGGTDEAISHSIAKGRNGVMPAHKNLLDEEKIHLLTAYVYSLSQE